MPTFTPAQRPARDSVLALLVDKDQDTRHLYAEYLKLGNWRVDEAGDGREALAKAIALRPDVIVTDTPSSRNRRHHPVRSAAPRPGHEHDSNRLRHGRHLSGGHRSSDGGRRPIWSWPSRVFLKSWRSQLRTVLAHSSESATALGRSGPKPWIRLARADEVLSRAVDTVHRRHTLKKAHHRGDTTNPPLTPPRLVCPSCDRPLAYRRSHIGGVSSKHAEQWDYFECESGCGTFQYRARTRKLRKVD